MFDDLNDDNIILYAAKCYDKPNCIIDEFSEDYKRIRYVKRLLQKYRKMKGIKERLILNHIIILHNVFGVEATARLLFFHIGNKDYSALKTFLLFINSMPAVLHGIRGQTIVSADIMVDINIASILNKI